MPDFDPSVVSRRIEEFRKSLLDTSLRNRLINFRVRTKAGKSLEKVIEVHGGDPGELLRLLVAEGKALWFSGRPDPSDRGPSSTGGDGNPVLSLGLDDDDGAGGHGASGTANGGEATDARDDRLNTHEFISTLRRKLTKIARDAKVGIEEQGVNVLYLALGVLEWYEAEGSDEVRRAPLLLVPVVLEPTARGSLRLKWDGGEVGDNLSIAAKLRGEFGLKLPQLPEDVEPASYFDAVAEVVQYLPRWRVAGDAIALAFFSYAKYLMYRDLDQDAWPEGARPGAHPVVGALLDSGFEEDEPGTSEQEFLDPLRVPGETCEIHDADGSQTLAILEANTGRSMLIEGPPGTGKSQTISNIIAEAVAAGRKVLFVAEKSAALDVVFRRLREAGLGDACLELHSNKTNKRGFYAELKRTVLAAPPQTARAENQLRQLCEAREALNGYCDAVNAPIEGRGISPRLAMGRLMRLPPDTDEDGRHDFGPMASWAQQDFELRYDMVRRLQEHLSRMGPPTAHPFWGSRLEMLLPTDKEDIRRSLAAAEEAVKRLASSLNVVAEALRVQPPIRPRPADLDQLQEWANYVSYAPRLAGVAVGREDWPEKTQWLHARIADARNLKALLRGLSGRIVEGALAQDPADVTAALRLGGLTKALSTSTASSLAVVLASAEAAQQAAEALEASARDMARRIGVGAPTSMLAIGQLATLAKGLAAAPDLTGMSVAARGWPEDGKDLNAALDAVDVVQTARRRFGGVLRDSAWDTDPEEMIGPLVEHGGSLLRRLFGRAFRRAYSDSASMFIDPPKSYLERLAGLRAVATVRDASHQLAGLRGRCCSYFGERWQGVTSEGNTLREALSWMIALHESIREGVTPIEVLAFLDGGGDPTLGMVADGVRANLAAARAATGDLRAALHEVGVPDADIGSGNQDEQLYRWLLDVLRPSLLPLVDFVRSSGGYADALARLDDIAETRRLKAELSAESDELNARFGLHWRDEESEFDHLTAVVDWLREFHTRVRDAQLPSGLIRFFDDNGQRGALPEAVKSAQEHRRIAQNAVRKVLELSKRDGDPEAFTEAPIADQQRRLSDWLGRLDDLQSLIVYNSLVREATAKGLGMTVALGESWAGAPEGLADSFARAWYTGMIRQAMEVRKELARFDRVSHEQLAVEFRQLDRLVLEINRRKAAVAHWRQVPRHHAAGALGWLQAQMELLRKHKPIRVAMEQAHEAIQAIKPVYLMSPLSIAMYLPADGPRFDLVLFDEASQVKPEDALGGLLRANQAIVVGDSKQMPPTSFFDKLTADDGTEDDEDLDEVGRTAKDLESVLALMSSKVPLRSPRRRDLRWHYRSRHDTLIAASNRMFYDDRLVVFPNPRRPGAGAGLVLRHDPTTVYGRGDARPKNPREAKQVAQAALMHVREHPGLTLGIAAFSKAQQEAIEDELDILRRDHHSAFAEFDGRHPFEPLFVKNLENVQGDERDVILISVGYGRDEKGNVAMNFGPLNRDGGERRLNVLITRARVRCEVFSNLRSTDIRAGEPPARGVVSLRQFLMFAETGSLDVATASGRDPMSPFEEEVLDRLRGIGYDVEPQVGSCGFFIDMAVRHPEDPEHFVLGIECDGAMYHSARAARDRDRLRQEVLESRGWRLHRIWSTDWFLNSSRELQRAAAAIQAAIAAADGVPQETRESGPGPSAPEIQIDDFHPEPTNATEALPYVFSTAKSPSCATELHNLTPSEMATWIGEIVREEAPVHKEEVLRRMRASAGVGRAGSRIRPAFAAGVRMAKRKLLCEERGDFLYRHGQSEYVVRSRAGFPPQSKRLDLVADEEICAAIESQISQSFRLPKDGAGCAVGRMLGFHRVTDQMNERILSCIESMCSSGKITDEGEWVRPGRE